MASVYLDHAATTPLDPRVRAAMAPFLEEQFANPSSRHAPGVRAAQALAESRRRVARALAVEPRRVVFTSGGTEALNLGLLGIARAARTAGRDALVVGPTEHACVRGAAAALEREGFELRRLRLDACGELDLEHAREQLDARVAVVAQMLVNNELGTLYDVRSLARLVRQRAPHARLLVDAVQAAGKLDCAPRELGADALALSAHKLHGPKGAGALVLASEFPLEPLVHGGGQERGLRSGTENVPACVGLGVALELAELEREATLARWRELRAFFVQRLALLPGARVLEAGRERVPSTVSLVWPGAPAAVRLHQLERCGVFASAGSACQAAKHELSPTLKALGLSDDDARSTLRFSFGRTTTREELEQALAALEQVGRELAPLVR
ncbi:MAG: cysteine desulfurase [Planctomycetes bacterium]|nr:cysteine desulfurase [Planctomycetota bacterium]